MHSHSWRGVALALTAGISAATGAAQTPEPRPSYSLYGVPGLIDMPLAFAAPDADLATTIGGFSGDIRTTLTFQITPRLSGSFRYAGFDVDTVARRPGTSSDLSFDRSFDLRFLLLKETALRPAVTIGLQDLAGTGLLAGEYIVASKNLTRTLDVTAGIGWGRLGSHGSFGNTGTRSPGFEGFGGEPSFDDWFRGDYALFGGLGLTLSPNLRVELEYSSDAYEAAVRADELDRDTSWNLGLDYRLANDTQLSVYALYGSRIAAQVSFVLNPKVAPVPGGQDEAPLPILRRDPAAVADTSWVSAPSPGIEPALAQALARDGLALEGLALGPTKATLRFENPRFDAEPQAVGRAARSMARVLPASVELFEIIPVSDGMALSVATLRRSDLEDYEFQASEAMQARVAITDGADAPRPVAEGRFPAFSWALDPYVDTGFFDPDTPVRVDVGLAARASYRITSNTKISGAIVKRLFGNLADTPAENSDSLPPVRTNFPSYLTDGDPGLESLSFSAFGQPARNVYSRLSVGYLESMFGGVSGEILWKPVDSRLGLGAELNHVQQRDFDRRLGFQDYAVTTGHLSAYYDFGTGFYGQIDAGRYLAGDVGATFTLDRHFSNGWRVRAFATFTDASAEDFGEGSFDKGILLVIPTSWTIGTASRSNVLLDLRPIQRDGGARLIVTDRLYPKVRDYDSAGIDDRFGRFWR